LAIIGKGSTMTVRLWVAVLVDKRLVFSVTRFHRDYYIISSLEIETSYEQNDMNWLHLVVYI